MTFFINRKDKMNNNIEEVFLKYEFALHTLLTELNILIKEYEFKNKTNPVEHIKSRIKTKESALEKLTRKGYPSDYENMVLHVHDMVGVRLVCSFMSDVYYIVNIIKSSKILKIKKEQDFIKNPKESGYSSYHINVLVPIYLNETTEYIEAEIQIRTVAMDFWATLEHKIRYKFEGTIPEEVSKELYNCSNEVKRLDDKMYVLNEIMNKYK